MAFCWKKDRVTGGCGCTYTSSAVWGLRHLGSLLSRRIKEGGVRVEDTRRTIVLCHLLLMPRAGPSVRTAAAGLSLRLTKDTVLCIFI